MKRGNARRVLAPGKGKMRVAGMKMDNVKSVRLLNYLFELKNIMGQRIHNLGVETKSLVTSRD